MILKETIEYLDNLDGILIKFSVPTRLVIMKSAAFAPSHITGFFEIKDLDDDPLKRGSRGAGVCLAQGVETEVDTTDTPSRISILINGIPSSRAVVSKAVATKLLELSKTRGLAIHHRIRVPIASGFGTSGAAAIGIALAGSEALGLGLSQMEAYQLAHTVEVELKTGLGTVAGEYCGGLEVRSKEGAPGFGEAFQVSLNGPYTVVALHNGPLETSRFLSDLDYRNKINSIGRAFSDRMIKTPNLQTFLRLTAEFSSAIQLGNEQLRKVRKVAEEHGYQFGMAMFGQTVFTVVRESEASEVANLIKKNGQEGNIITAPVDKLGARLIESPFCVSRR